MGSKRDCFMKGIIAAVYAFISTILSEALVFYALSKGQLSITSTIISRYPIYTMILSFIIIMEILSEKQYVFIIVTIFGILMPALSSKLNRDELLRSKAVFWPFIAAIS